MAGALRLEARVCFVGMGNVGKSHLFRRCFLDEAFDPANPPARKVTADFDLVMADMMKWQPEVRVGGVPKKIAPLVWDFGGQLVLHGFHELFLRDDGRTVYVLVLDQGRTPGRARSGNEETGNGLVYWLKMLRHFAGPTAPVIIAVTQCDLAGYQTVDRPIDEPIGDGIDYAVTSDGARDLLAQKYGVQINAIVDNVSALNDVKRVQKLRVAVEEAIGSFADTTIATQTFAEEYIRIRDRVRVEFASEPVKVMRKERYRELCVEVGVSDRDEGFLRGLHYDGVAFYLDKTLKEQVEVRGHELPAGHKYVSRQEVPETLRHWIASPNWLKAVAYSFISKVQLKGQGALSDAELRACGSDLGDDGLSYLRDFLKYAGLSYYCEGHYYFPRARAPMSLKLRAEDWHRQVLRYAFLPESAFHRLVVDLLNDGEVEKSNRTLSYDSTDVVAELYGRKVLFSYLESDDSIEVFVKSPASDLTSLFKDLQTRVKAVIKYLGSFSFTTPVIVGDATDLLPAPPAPPPPPGPANTILPQSKETEMWARVASITTWIDVATELGTDSGISEERRGALENMKTYSQSTRKGSKRYERDGFACGATNSGVIWKASLDTSSRVSEQTRRYDRESFERAYPKACQ